jgi:hypothetical protein
VTLNQEQIDAFCAWANDRAGSWWVESAKSFIGLDDLAHTLAALQSELSELRALATEMAESDPNDGEFRACRYCTGHRFNWEQDERETTAFAHAPDCLWLRAQRWKR